MIKWDEIKTDCGNTDYFLELGVKKKSENEIQISVWRPNTTSCDLRLHENGKKVRYTMYTAGIENGKDIYTISLHGENIAEQLQGVEYDFVADGTTFVEPYAKEIAGRERFGKKRGKIKSRFDFVDFDWRGENWHRIPSHKMVMYQCHVRGFTKHSSSGVSAPGTFLGLQEKIPYLKELGVNTLLLLPVYDFDEKMKDENGSEIGKINYWGYSGDAFYFAPKQAYASDTKRVTLEFQQLIKALHAEGMNVFLDMYFENKSPMFVLQCLRYYALRFHIDGFRVNQDKMDLTWLSSDPVLSHVRLLGLSWEEPQDEQSREQLFEMNDRFMIDARCFLKSDEGQTEKFYHRFREQRKGMGLIHYITQHNGFTLRDLISYDIKHNEANGEKNHDGADYNYSWNCGVEGPTRRKDVLRWRARQEKNALVMLLLGMATPMLLAGDEFGNSQKGNNNAYCQDNATTWLDWRLLEKNHETLEFVKKLLQIRKNNLLYHQEGLLTGLDGKALGAPDVSCHGKEPWNVHFSYYSREVGILYYGGYFGGKSLYFAFNSHWETHEFYLPDVNNAQEWRVLFDTSGQKTDTGVVKKYKVQPRSVVLFEATNKKGCRKSSIPKK